jgi:hypothetical protein
VVRKDIKTDDLCWKERRTGRTWENFVNIGKGYS